MVTTTNYYFSFNFVTGPIPMIKNIGTLTIPAPMKLHGVRWVTPSEQGNTVIRISTLRIRRAGTVISTPVFGMISTDELRAMNFNDDLLPGDVLELVTDALSGSVVAGYHGYAVLSGPSTVVFPGGAL